LVLAQQIKDLQVVLKQVDQVDQAVEVLVPLAVLR
jgi:hypothetical protein|tara:strand:- start:410 stop:514 length:105 start_codon:yes stop_codon:yes gene_type:complete